MIELAGMADMTAVSSMRRLLYYRCVVVSSDLSWGKFGDFSLG